MAGDFLRKSDFASAPLAVYSFEPLGYSINKGAEKLWEDHRTTARFVSAAQYLTNPIDRAIQAVVTPFFTSASFVYNAYFDYRNTFSEGKEGSKLDKAWYIGLQAVAFLPAVAVKSVLIWTALAVNTVIHLFPFKVISACEDNRPFNFFVRRDCHRLDHQYRTFLSEVFSPIWSDKYYTQWTKSRELSKMADVPAIASANCADEIQAYDVESARQQFDKDLVLRGKRMSPFLKNCSREEFLNILNRHVSAFYVQGSSLRNYTVATCPFLHHLEYYAGLDSLAGLDAVFFLPEGLDGAVKIVEIEWRYGFCLRLLGRIKDYNSIVEGSMTKSDVQEASLLHRAELWIQRVEAVLAYTYQRLVPQTGQAPKSANNV